MNLMQHKKTNESANSENLFAEKGIVIEVFKGKAAAAGKFVIVATDTSVESRVSNNVESIAEFICLHLKANADQIIFIEHRQRCAHFEETFDLVHLEFNELKKTFHKPAWSAFSQKATEALKGEKLYG